MLNFVYYPVSAILWVWHKVFGYLLGPENGIAWTLAVMFLVFTLRAILIKPFVSQIRSMRKMQEFAPEIQKLKAKYGDDRQKMAAELQKLQTQHGVNPLGGCLPVLVQIPVFIGLFHVLRSFNRPFLSPEENRQIGNYVFSPLDVQSFLDARLFGVPLASFITEPVTTLSRYGDITRWEIAAVAVPLTIVAGVLTHLTARHSVARQTAAQTANPQTAIMNKVMLYLFPLGVVAGGPFFPLAILIYWLSNNLWTLGQQHVIYQKIDAEEAVKKETALAQRQSLGPRPGQKPVRPKKESAKSDKSVVEPAVPAEADEQAGSEPTNETSREVSGQSPNGSAVSSGTGSADGAAPDGAAPDGAAPDGAAPGGASSRAGAKPARGSTTSGMIQPRPRARKKTNRKRH